MATLLTRSSPSQSASRSSSRVTVPNVRTSRPLEVSTQATTVLLWTSKPQHRSCTTCIADLTSSLGGRTGGRTLGAEDFPLRALDLGEATISGACRVRQPNLTIELVAPKTSSGSLRQAGLPIFIVSGA